jgi:flagellar FliL protein
MAEAAAAAATAAEVKPVPVPAAGIPIKLVLIIGAVALLLGLGGAIAYVKLTAEHKTETPPAEAAAAAPEAKPEEHGKPAAAPAKGGAPGTIFDLDPFIVNLADAPEVRYLKLTLKLELDRADAAGDLNNRLPQVRDAILILLSGKDSAALRSTQGKFQLRDDITLRVNAVLPRPGVRTAYFTEFVIQ